MTFQYKIKIVTICVTTKQLIGVLVFIVWKVQPLMTDFVVPWNLSMELMNSTSVLTTRKDTYLNEMLISIGLKSIY